MRASLLSILFLLIVTTTASLGGVGRNPHAKVSIGFWNVENLYDTIPSIFYDDSDYTPEGRFGWNTERYQNKLKNIARVIDQMSLDVIGLAEVESEVVLRDLVLMLQTDYNYVHRSSGDWRGMDVVLLYKGDKFIPERVEMIKSGSSREFLYVVGALYGHRVDFVVCHLPSMFNKRSDRERVFANLRVLTDSIHQSNHNALPIIMGDFNATPDDRAFRVFVKDKLYDNRINQGSIGLYSPLSEQVKRGVGSYAYGGRWQLLDNIFISRRMIGGESVRYGGVCGVFIKDYLLDSYSPNRLGYPYRTFSGGRYLGGYSDHLPVYLYLDIF